MLIEDLVGLSLQDLAAVYAARRLSPVEVMQATLAQAEAVNPAINAFANLHPDEALRDARASEARWAAQAPLGLLDGVPLSVKDSIAVAGWPYTHGLKANAAQPPSAHDAPPVLALRESGAALFGKTTMPDCGLLASGVSSLFGVTRNPWGLAWNTGGSSSGGGASIAAGAGFVTVGTDIAGSVRLPAAQCGLASLKPTHGRVPHLPADPMRMAGPMGRRVADIARLLAVLTRTDERDTWSLRDDGTPYHAQLDRDLRGVRVGVMSDIGFGPPVEPLVAQAVATAGQILEAAGAVVTPFLSPLEWDAYAPLDLLFQVRGHVEIAALPPHGAGGVEPHVRAWAAEGARHSGADVQRALVQVGRMKAQWLAAFAPYDYLIAPTLPMVAFPAEAAGPDAAMPLGHAVYTAPFNQTGQPAATIAMAFDPRHLPIGVQVIGHRFDDLGVLQVAQALERMRGITMDWPLVPRA